MYDAGESHHLEIAMKTRLLPLFALVAFVGCSKVHEERSFTLLPGAFNTLHISEPLSEQKVKVVVKSDVPVNVYVILEKNIPAGKDEYEPDTIKEGVVAKEKNTMDVTLTATIPAKNAYVIYVDGANKKASVSVTINSQ
jgi:hypothetical protein